MKPSFSEVQRKYPKTESRETLFTEIGWIDLIDNTSYCDTCAIRMSYALRLARVPFVGGNMRARAGKIKGQLIQLRQGNLSRALKRL